MQITLAVLVFLIASLCAEGGKDCSAISEEHDCLIAKENEALKQLEKPLVEIVSNKGRKIILKLETKVLELKDNPKGEGSRSHYFLGYNKKLDAFLVKILGSEWREFRLISRSDGEIFEIHAYPHISPSGNQFATFTEGAYNDPKAFRIFQKNGLKWVIKYELLNPDWNTYPDIIWASDSEIHIKTSLPAKGAKIEMEIYGRKIWTEYELSTAHLKYRDSKWVTE